MPTTVFSTLENAMTVQGLLDAWSAAFGLPPHVPDTAAIVTAPNLLSGKLLGQYLLSDLTLDAGSVKPMSGSFTVTQADPTGLIVASFSVKLPLAANVLPIGLALYNAAAGHLDYLAILTQPASAFDTIINWSARITLGSCMG